MGRTPPRARRRSIPVLFAGALLINASFALPASSATGKRPDGVPGHGNGNAYGHGNGGPKHADAPQATAAPLAAPTQTAATNGNGNGNANGRGKSGKKAAS